MARETYIHHLEELRHRVMQLGESVDSAIRLGVASLKYAEPILADAVISGDAQINHDRYSLEEDAVTLIATEQPVAGDLRLIMAVVVIVNELERMGDHAKGIARIAKMLKGAAAEPELTALHTMADTSRDTLRAALDAFNRTDADAARATARRDDDLDAQYNAFSTDILTAMHNNTLNSDDGTHLLWVAHNLERIGDRTVNICERTIYIATGVLVETTSRLPTR